MLSDDFNISLSAEICGKKYHSNKDFLPEKDGFIVIIDAFYECPYKNLDILKVKEVIFDELGIIEGVYVYEYEGNFYDVRIPKYEYFAFKEII
jgi:hypothetical protein